MERIEGLGFMTRAAKEAGKSDAAQGTHGHLLDYIAEFEGTLTDAQEIGARVGSFGTDLTIHLESLSYENPDLISFCGADSSGRRVQLVQHHSQTNVMFVALPSLHAIPLRLGARSEDRAL